MADTKLLKMHNGENLIAKVTSNDDGTLTVIDALGIQLMGSDPKNATIMFYTAFPFAEEPNNVVLPKSAVVYMLAPDKGIAAGYLQKTSGLITPSAGGLPLPKAKG